MEARDVIIEVYKEYDVIVFRNGKNVIRVVGSGERAEAVLKAMNDIASYYNNVDRVGCTFAMVG